MTGPYVTGGSADARRAYMQSFQDRVEEILKSLNLSEATKKYLCPVVNGKAGKIRYADLLFAWEHGDAQFLIQDIQEYAAPSELLSMVDSDPKHWKPKVLPARPAAPTKRESAETWNFNLKNILLAIVIGAVLYLIATGRVDLVELVKRLFDLS